MMKLTIALVLTATAATSYAKDSTWLLCKGVGVQADKTKTYIVASLLEHRGVADRDLGVTVIYGDHVTRGAIVGKAAAPFSGKPTALKLANVGKAGTAFTGTATLADDMTTFSLKGSIDFTFGDDPKAKPQGFEAKLTCEALDDAAIGH